MGRAGAVHVSHVATSEGMAMQHNEERGDLPSEVGAPWWEHQEGAAPGPQQAALRPWLLICVGLGLAAFLVFFVMIGVVAVKA